MTQGQGAALRGRPLVTSVRWNADELEETLRRLHREGHRLLSVVAAVEGYLIVTEEPEWEVRDSDSLA